MTKRRSKKKGTRRTKRRKMSGVHPALAQTGMMILGAGVGGIASAFVNQAVKTSFPTMPSYVGGAASVIGGGLVIMFAPPGPLMTGVAVGLAAGGAIFATNETVLSLPGISGIPMGLPNSTPGYLSNSVGSYRGIPQNRIGNLSGNDTASIGALRSN